MKYFVLLLLTASVCYATPINGVLVQERVIKLPEDSTKWHISVVGDQKDARYTEVLGWFESDKLKGLKDRVHFHAITTDSSLYAERYKPNIKGLPTVRVQDAVGRVIYEASRNLPMTGDGLYSAIAAAANGSEELLPWRRNHSNPTPVPTPDPAPDTDPAPGPIDDGGAPVFEEQYDWQGWAVGACIVLFVVGLIVGRVEAAKQYHKKVDV